MTKKKIFSHDYINLNQMLNKKYVEIFAYEVITKYILLEKIYNANYRVCKKIVV